MSKTRAETRFKILAILTGGDIGVLPSDEDAENIDGYIDSVIAELDHENIIYISDAEAIEDQIFLTFCKIVANAAADEYGAASDEQKGLLLRNRLRVLSAQIPGYGPQAAEYF